MTHMITLICSTFISTSSSSTSLTSLSLPAAAMELPAFMAKKAADGDQGQKRKKGQQESQSSQLDAIMELCTAIGAVQVDQDRELREHSAILNRVVLMPYDKPVSGYLSDGVDAGEEFLQEMRQRPGEEIGSPHVRVSLQTLSNLLADKDVGKDRTTGPAPGRRNIRLVKTLLSQLSK